MKTGPLYYLADPYIWQSSGYTYKLQMWYYYFRNAICSWPKWISTAPVVSSHALSNTWQFNISEHCIIIARTGIAM